MNKSDKGMGTLIVSVLLMSGLGTFAATTIIADFGGDFTPSLNGAGSAYVGTEVPATGWSYLYSTNGGGVAANYLPMVANTNTAPEAWSQNQTPHTSTTNIVVGVGVWRPSISANARAIAAYTIQPGEEGQTSVLNSSVLNTFPSGNGVVMNVYVNDTLMLSNRVIAADSEGDFNCALGTLSEGDVVYVAMDNNQGSLLGDYPIVDYQLVSGDPLIVAADISSTNIFATEATTLSWSVSPNADTVAVSPAIQGETDLLPLTVNGVGSIDAYPLSNTTYTFIVARGVEAFTNTYNVTVNPMQINSFLASAAVVFDGDDVVLTWDVDGSTGITITEDTEVLLATSLKSGSYTIVSAIFGQHTYTLTATNGIDEVVANVNVEVQQPVSSTTIVDPNYTNGIFHSNGSFEFDTNGVVHVGNPVTGNTGFWTVAPNPILGADRNVDVVRVRTNQGATDGLYALEVGKDPGVGSLDYGGVLNTGYVVQPGNTFTFSFQFKDTAWEGEEFVQVRLFTSSNDTLSGTLTPVFTNDYTKAINHSWTSVLEQGITTTVANENREIWIAFSHKGGGNDFAMVDDVRLLLEGEANPGNPPGNIVISSGDGLVNVGVTNLSGYATYILQSADNLVVSNWVDIASATGVSSADWTVPTTNDVEFLRVIRE